jgi:carbamoyltransferase
MDAMGDGVGLTVSIGRDNHINRIFQQSGLNAPGFFYSRITEILGFRPNNHEGKITGLAAYGNPALLVNEMDKMFHFSDGKIIISNCKRDYSDLKKYKREDVAAAAQRVFENTIVEFVQFWVDTTKIYDVCLSGGVFNNVKLNQRIHQSSRIKSVYVFPNMGDGGLALGAVYSFLQPLPVKFKNIFLGPRKQESSEEIDILLRQYGLIVYKKGMKKPEHVIAALLASGKIVAIHKGGQEYGPRALGNHSILCKTDDPALNSILNKKLKRTEFMPFAPVTLDKHADLCYTRIKGAEYTARFMTITFDCTSFMNEKCPCVVHVDTTARPQILEREDNLFLYELLDYYYQITGVPAILNTSFNIHEEPIVFSHEDAVRTFISSELDYLLIDEILLTRS